MYACVDAWMHGWMDGWMDVYLYVFASHKLCVESTPGRQACTREPDVSIQVST